MSDAVDLVDLVEVAGDGADGWHPWRLPACESAVEACLVDDTSEKNSLEIETVALERPHGDHSVSYVVGARQAHRSEST